VREGLLLQGLKPVYKRPFRVTTDSRHDESAVPNMLARRSGGRQPDEPWVGDITYLRTDEGWPYLACVMDLGSRRMVRWSMDERIEADLVCDTLKSAHWRRTPWPGLMLHSDCGSQWASAAHRRLLGEDGVVQSMSHHRNCWNNTAMESFFKTPKVERAYHVTHGTRAEARLDVLNWIENFYNRRRRHSSTGYRPPIDVDQGPRAG